VFTRTIVNSLARESRGDAAAEFPSEAGGDSEAHDSDELENAEADALPVPF
jgi:hypothetical protein